MQTLRVEMKFFVGQGQAALWLCVLLLCGAAVSEQLYFNSSVPVPKETHKFLFLVPTNLPSHVMTVAPLIAALATRGNEVHMLCETPDVYKIPNVTCIPAGVNLPQLDQLPTHNCFESSLTHMQLVISTIEQTAELLFSSPAVLQLYNNRKQYDVIVLEELAMPVLYPFAYETTFALFSTAFLNPCQSAEFGNAQNPAYVTSGVANYPQPYSFLDRLKNCAQTFLFCFSYRLMSRSAEGRIREQFPELPSPVEIERNASLFFLMSSAALDGPLALLPTQVSVGGLILRPSQPLPQDIADFIDGEDPVIYLSFGVTFVREDTIDPQKKNMLISVLRRLSYKVIFKIKGQKKKKVENILFHNDVPQQDILAHQNVKVFVSHCGLAGTHEAVYHGVPIVCFPATWEHVKTASTLETAGVGIRMVWNSFTEEQFENAVTEVMTNPSYRRNMAVMSQKFRDQPEAPLDRAVYWTEYVARHRGAPHLQSPAKQLSWLQILNIDLIAGLFLMSYVVYLLFRRSYKALFARPAAGTEKQKLL